MNDDFSRWLAAKHKWGTQPVPATMPLCAGIFHGACARAVMRDGGPLGIWPDDEPGIIAHSHTHPDDYAHGWICFAPHYRHRPFRNNGQPSTTLLHEYAHLVAADSGCFDHGYVWQEAVTELGAGLEVSRYVELGEVAGGWGARRLGVSPDQLQLFDTFGMEHRWRWTPVGPIAVPIRRRRYALGASSPG